jgi:hypothetical protein
VSGTYDDQSTYCGLYGLISAILVRTNVAPSTSLKTCAFAASAASWLLSMSINVRFFSPWFFVENPWPDADAEP